VYTPTSTLDRVPSLPDQYFFASPSPVLTSKFETIRTVFSVEVSATVDLDHGLACLLDCLVTKTAVKTITGLSWAFTVMKRMRP